jgi:transcriptional regulator with XRE-family HTH domain
MQQHDPLVWRELTLGEALRAWRLAAGLKTQHEASKVLGYRENSLSRWETSAAEPRVGVLIHMRHVYGAAPFDVLAVVDDAQENR